MVRVILIKDATVEKLLTVVNLKDHFISEITII